jgi:hypothetical protein
MSKILSAFFVRAYKNMGNINLVLGPVIKILEQIEKPPTSLSKPYYLRFDGVKRELTAVSKALQSMAIPSAGTFSPTVIDKSCPTESIGSRLRDHTRTFDYGVRARSAPP